MNFKLNALVAAAMMVAAGTANAQIADSNDNTNELVNNSGDMFASVVSAKNTATFTVDLGLTLNQFVSAVAPTAKGVKLVWDMDAGTFSDLSSTATGLTGLVQPINYGTVYTTFATAAVVGSTDLKFDIKAMDGTPGLLAATGTNRYLSTSLADSITATNSQVFAMDNEDSYVVAANSDATNSTQGTSFGIAGANMFDAGDGANVYFESTGDQWNGASTFSSVGNVGDLLNFYSLFNSSKTGSAQATVTQYSGVWSFDTATAQLSYTTAPVPEAETYAMMLAGLGLVGFMVSRRRNRV